MILNEDKKIIFIHIPRTGGSTIKQLFGRQDLFGKHQNASQMKTTVGDAWDSYFKFSVVRNPWDWAVSYYHYMQGIRQTSMNITPTLMLPGERFTDWVNRKFPDGASKGDLFSKVWLGNQDGEMIIDHVIRYENFQESVADVLHRFSMEIPTFPQINVSERGPYQEYYNDQTRYLISRSFWRDIEVFNYTF